MPLLSLLVFLGGCDQRPALTVEKTATLLYTHDVQGDIEPCG